MKRNPTIASSIISKVCAEHRNSDLRADDNDIIAALDAKFADLERSLGEAEAKMKLAEERAGAREQRGRRAIHSEWREAVNADVLDVQTACAHLWGFHCCFLEEGDTSQQIPVKCMLCGAEDTWTRSQCLAVLVSVFMDNAKKRKQATLAQLMN